MLFPHAAGWPIVFCASVFGGIVGSFLNVVVYRLPRGIGLIHPPSQCPSCGKSIRWFDNVPVFGWIVLGGRCRHCRGPISIRYPAVEAFTAVMFGALAAVENPWQLVYLYHLVLLCTLLCAALMAIDGNRPPLRLFIPAAVVVLLWILIRVARLV